MIDYQKGFLGLPSFLYWYGSVVPRCLLPAVTSASITLLVKWIYPPSREDAETEADDVVDAYGPSMAALNFIVGFIVVYRAQQGYAR